MNVDTGQLVGAAVLTGGQSRRMGEDKALLEISGVTMLERVLSVLQRLSEDVLIVGERDAYHHFGFPVVPDTYGDAGPLGGIATALRHLDCDAVVIVGCDMPFLNEDLLRAMTARLPGYDAVVPARRDASGDRRLHPLHAVYATRCQPVLVDQIRSGILSVHNALRGLRVDEVNEQWTKRYDPEYLAFLNVNTPADVRAAMQIVRTRDTD